LRLSEEHILFEDNHLLIINKPSGILSQGDRTGDPSILDLAKTYIKTKYNKPGAVFLGLPHRLDRPTSGALILCRTSKSLSRVTELFRNKQIDKIYHAIVIKLAKEKSSTVTSYLKKNTKLNKAVVKDRPFDDAKSAILHYDYLKERKNRYLLEVNLETGRPHQIRAQLNFIAMPILGDLKYHHQKPLSDKSIGLHSRKLELVHPVTKQSLKIIAAYPKTNWWQVFED